MHATEHDWKVGDCQLLDSCLSFNKLFLADGTIIANFTYDTRMTWISCFDIVSKRLKISVKLTNKPVEYFVDSYTLGK